MRKYIFTIVLFGIITGFTYNVKAIPYKTYNYNYWGRAVESPDAYEPVGTIDGNKLNIQGFKNPSSISTDKNMNLYIADSGNNRVICLDNNFKLKRIISNFKNNEKEDALKNPNDVFIKNNGDIYIADTDNSRIVSFNSEGKFLREYKTPQSELLPKDYVYKPYRFVLDEAERFYVVAQNINQGIMELDKEGNFKAFIGAGKVIPDPVEMFWRSISTKKQKEAMVLFVPTEYNNISISEDNFLYVTTNIDSNTLMGAIRSRNKSDIVATVRKLNLTGKDIMKREGYFPPLGDVDLNGLGSVTGPSAFTDVTMDEVGIYNVLDQKRGKIFTYDPDGNLLYVFGGLGQQRGTFNNPVSMIRQGDKLLVLDKISSNVTIFNITEYGRLVNQAVKLYYDGDYEGSSNAWEKCLKYNSNLDLVYVGIGKNLLRQDKYEAAMSQFKLGNSKILYSKAFKLYRKELVSRYLGITITLLVLIIVGSKVYRNIKITVDSLKKEVRG
jgi:tetratricopeptide (TPR) repeat protein